MKEAAAQSVALLAVQVQPRQPFVAVVEAQAVAMRSRARVLHQRRRTGRWRHVAQPAARHLAPHVVEQALHAIVDGALDEAGAHGVEHILAAWPRMAAQGCEPGRLQHGRLYLRRGNALLHPARPAILGQPGQLVHGDGKLMLARRRRLQGIPDGLVVGGRRHAGAVAIQGIEPLKAVAYQPAGAGNGRRGRCGRRGIRVKQFDQRAGVKAARDHHHGAVHLLAPAGDMRRHVAFARQAALRFQHGRLVVEAGHGAV